MRDQKTVARRLGRALSILGGLVVASALSMAASHAGAQTAAKPPPASANSTAQIETDRFLKGAIDMHFHVDPVLLDGPRTRASIEQIGIAKARGLRGLVLKDHNESTVPLAYHFRHVIPDFEIFGSVVMNIANGGINPGMVRFMATQIQGKPGRVVWMPAGDSEIEIKTSDHPDRPFVAVTSKDGQLLPGVKEILAIAAKENLVVASGHIAAKDALILFAEAKKMGVKHMVATHAMDLSGKMTLAQMKEAAALGAIIEFDFRNTLDENGVRADAIRALGPEHCLISEFWTNNATLEYGAPEKTYAFIVKMRQKGFSDRDLDTMTKDNPARLLELPLRP